MKPTFDSTVAILVKAYLNDTLSHNTCGKCAVGNIIEHSYGSFQASMPYANGMCGYGWSNVFCTEATSREQRIFPYHYRDEAKRQIDATGYTWQELARIENTFELNDKSMFVGLMAVVDVLAKIHNIDLSQKEEAKKLFVKRTSLPAY